LSIITETQDHLFDPTDEREDLILRADYAEGISAIGMIASCILSLISVVSIVANPFFGSLGLIVGTASFLVSRDIFIISRNVKRVFGSDEMPGNISDRLNHVWKRERVVNSLLEDTYVIGPYFHASIYESCRTEFIRN